MIQSKSFKIRKSSRNKLQQDLQDYQLVLNLQQPILANKVSKYENQQSQQRVYKVKEYRNDEENINCYRFIHQSFCGCNNNCLLQTFQIYDIVDGLYYGSYVSGLKTKYLLEHNITHILNVSCKQYTKRNYYFQYLNIDLHNNTQQDAKKFFRLSNRFIKQAIEHQGNVFIHSSNDEIAAVMAIGYMIGILKIPLKQAMQKIKKIQINPHFMKQIQSYDMQRMAFVSISRV